MYRSRKPQNFGIKLLKVLFNPLQDNFGRLTDSSSQFLPLLQSAPPNSSQIRGSITKDWELWPQENVPELHSLFWQNNSLCWHQLWDSWSNYTEIRSDLFLRSTTRGSSNYRRAAKCLLHYSHTCLFPSEEKLYLFKSLSLSKNMSSATDKLLRHRYSKHLQIIRFHCHAGA